MQNRMSPKKSSQPPSISILRNPWESPTANLVIDITQDKKEIIGLDGRVASVFVSNILIDGKTISLDSLNYDNSLAIASNKQYDITFKYCSQGQEKQLKLSPEMNKNLLRFFQDGRRPGENCMDFINDMYFGCGVEKLNNINFQGFPVPFEDEKNLKPGQAIAIFKDDKLYPNHFAIYLADGLYLSIMGTDQPLFVTTLEQMKIIYQDHCGALVNPIPAYESKPILSVKI